MSNASPHHQDAVPIAPSGHHLPAHRRWLLMTIGFLALGLGALGVVLPLLPTTPFLILSAACFARSSEHWYRRLIGSRAFGPLILNWERDRCISRKTKWISFGLMLAVGAGSIGFALESLSARLVGFGLIAVGMGAVWRIPTCTDCQESPASEGGMDR